ncbi:potassium channel protein [Thiospirochaeta perfilievii]|uniref:Potassium channel protein n=1 Tax=Thiospirochaeta perfilievii TaxID=252967 RepID=A0A5C1QDX0_9SPIO|nr:potassium channel family protein [Thiospirochaeta perfilievii]QEN04846.1 potassium channel protein [Thiospirochaeta perfilievii]
MDSKNIIKKIHSIFKRSSFLFPLLMVTVIIWIFGFVLFFLENSYGNPAFTSLFDGIWAAIITLSSTGYGLKVAESFPGRIFTFVIIFFGIGLVSYLSGVFASLFVDRNSKARRGLMDFPKLKNHLVICGWSKRMKEILSYVIEESTDISSNDIILLNNADPEQIELLRETKLLEDIKFVRGDFFAPTHLLRANIKDARKVIVLADTLMNTSFSEIDSKTIMTVMTIKSISRDTYVCAELLDKKYEGNLKQASCDEILLSREMAKNIIANATMSQGMSHILNELLSGTESILKTMEIPGKFIGREYVEFLKDVGKTGLVVLGILENAVPVNIMKMEALREAQKTTDISRLVQNLQDVKGMSVNNPYFAPSKDYIIKNYSMAIVLERLNGNE